MSGTDPTPPAATPPLSEWELHAATRARLEAELFKLNKATLLNALALAGVTEIIVTFDGYGDSGQVENIEVRAGDDEARMPTGAIELAEARWGKSEPERSTVNIATAIERLAYDVLEATHCGWEDGDGAYGDVVFDIAEQTITLDYNERYTASNNHTHRF